MFVEQGSTYTLNLMQPINCQELFCFKSDIFKEPIKVTVHLGYFYCLVFIHQREEKIWVSVGFFPQPVPLLKLGIDNKTDIVSIEFTLIEKLTELMDQANARCGDYEGLKNGFNVCCQKYIGTMMRNATTCTVPGN